MFPAFTAIGKIFLTEWEPAASFCDVVLEFGWAAL